MNTIGKFPIFGLTGGIASGKSAAAAIFRKLGIPVLDADAIARELRAPGGAAADPILKAFGTLDPKELRIRISTESDAKRRLEAILHPLIIAESTRRFSELPSDAPYALYEAALLVESGRDRDFAGLILIESSPEIQLARLVERDGMELSSARQFLGAQSSAAVKRTAATYHITNNGTLPELESKVRLLHSALLRGEKSFSA